jgi:hypothetical protein
MMDEEFNITGTVTKAEEIAALEDCINNSGHTLANDYRRLWPYSNSLSAKDYYYLQDLKSKANTGSRTERIRKPFLPSSVRTWQAGVLPLVIPTSTACSLRYVMPAHPISTKMYFPSDRAGVQELSIPTCGTIGCQRNLRTNAAKPPYWLLPKGPTTYTEQTL